MASKVVSVVEFEQCTTFVPPQKKGGRNAYGLTSKGLIDKLVKVDQMDRFQIIGELSRFRLPVLSNENDIRDKLRLKKVIIEEILKTDDVEDKEFYMESLTSISRQLNDKIKLFGCCLAGCRFEAPRHRDYVKH